MRFSGKFANEIGNYKIGGRYNFFAFFFPNLFLSLQLGHRPRFAQKNSKAFFLQLGWQGEKFKYCVNLFCGIFFLCEEDNLDEIPSIIFYNQKTICF